MFRVFSLPNALAHMAGGLGFAVLTLTRLVKGSSPAVQYAYAPVPVSVRQPSQRDSSSLRR